MSYNSEEIAKQEHEEEQKRQWRISEGNVLTVLTHWEREQLMADYIFVARETIRRFPEDTFFDAFILGNYIKTNMVKLKQDSLPILMKIYGPKIIQLPQNEGVVYMGGHRNSERHGISLATEYLFRPENEIPNEREIVGDKAKNFGLPDDIDEGFKCVPGRGRGKPAFGFVFNYRFGPGKMNYIELATNRTVAGRGSGMVNRASNSNAHSNERGHQDDVDTFESIHQIESDTSFDGKYWRDLVAEKNRRAAEEKRRREEEERAKKVDDSE